MKMKGKVCDVQWDDSEGVQLMKSHTDFLEPWYDDRLNRIGTILPVLEVGAALAPAGGNETTSLPRDFFEALVREDRRDWSWRLRRK
jgi:hypothetical protein